MQSAFPLPDAKQHLWGPQLVRGKRRGWRGVVGGVLVDRAGCPLLCLLLVGSGEASVLGAFSFHLFLLYFFILLFLFFFSTDGILAERGTSMAG
jgi:hypothetical protein